MLQFMVRGISQHLDYPVAHFATSTLTAEQLYPMVWEVVGKLEAADLKVKVITADGASANRKFFRLHREPSGSNVCNGVVYKTTNVHATKREVYFMSDVPHLLKTVRNCWEKSRFGGTRLMMARDKDACIYTCILHGNGYILQLTMYTDMHSIFAPVRTICIIFIMCLLYTMLIPAERRPLHLVEPHSRLVQQVTGTIRIVHWKEADKRARKLD